MRGCSVLRQLQLASEVLNLKEKPNNEARALFKDFQKDVVPKQWHRYTVEKMSISLWIDDFSQRIETLQKVCAVHCSRLRGGS